MLKGACAAGLRYIRPFRAASWGACPRTERGETMEVLKDAAQRRKQTYSAEPAR